MSQTAGLPEHEVRRLQQFHVEHFPNQSVPTISISSTTEEFDAERPTERAAEQDDLGFYEDSVRRTLTDDQIAMFRNSEIQRLLAQRRRQREQEQDEREELELKREELKARLLVTTKHNANQPQRQEKRPVFADDIAGEVDSLVYDEIPIDDDQPRPFLWPKLG